MAAMAQRLYSFLVPKISAKFQRDHPQRGAPNRAGVGSSGDFRPVSRYSSETVQDRDIVTMES